METFKPDSTMIEETRYINEGINNTVLYVKFTNGKVYRYADVSAKHYTFFTSAESAGKYFNTYIKPKYPASKLPKGFPEKTKESK